MDKNNFYALVFGYYLARFDKKAYESLGFKSWINAYEWAAAKFNSNPNSIKIRRDEFDPYFDNQRRGYYQRPMRSSRKKIFDLFKNIPFEELKDIFDDIKNNGKSEKIEPFYNEISELNDDMGKLTTPYNNEKGKIKVEEKEIVLENLSTLMQKINTNYKNKFENKFETSTVILSDAFKKNFENFFIDTIDNVEKMLYNRDGALVIYNDNHREYISNTQLLLASFLPPIYNSVLKYKNEAIKILLSTDKYTENDLKNEKSKAGILINSLRNAPKTNEKNKTLSSEEKYEDLKNKRQAAEKFIRPYFNKINNNNDILEKNIEYMTNFFCDTSWWNGGKNFLRNEFFASPIYGTLNLVAQSSGSIEKALKVYCKHSELLNDIDSEIIIQDYINKKATIDTIIPANIKRASGGNNLIVYGAPGTGKSNYIEQQYKENITRVVFHPEYTFFDFVGSYRPVPIYEITNKKFTNTDGSAFQSGDPHIDYRFVTGPFTDVLIESWRDPDKIYTLLIEELNRADAAAVFGSIFQLLDRDNNGTSKYSITPSDELRAELICHGLEECIKDGLRIPSNMNIIATMNSADQGVNFLDTAFKRRWKYKYLKINIDTALHKDENITYANKKMHWGDFRSSINNKLMNTYQIEEDRLLGPYFIGPDELKSNPDDSIKKILFYLWDDVLRHKEKEAMFGNIRSMAQLMDSFKENDVLNLFDESAGNPNGTK